MKIDHMNTLYFKNDLEMCMYLEELKKKSHYRWRIINMIREDNGEVFCTIRYYPPKKEVRT